MDINSITNHGSHASGMDFINIVIVYSVILNLPAGRQGNTVTEESIFNVRDSSFHSG